MTISTLAQADIACKTPTGFGIGAMQWSNDRRDTLYENYDKQAVDGMLSIEQIKEAELQTISDELTGSYYNRVVVQKFKTNAKHNTSDDITLATCIIFRNYEAPDTYNQVDPKKGYSFAEGVTDSAENAEKFDDLPAIYKRVLAAKAAYEAFN